VGTCSALKQYFLVTPNPLSVCLMCQNCGYEHWRVPGPHVTAISFANMSRAIVSMVDGAPRAMRPCMMAVLFFGVLPCVNPSYRFF
jgi:hypothetical protein